MNKQTKNLTNMTLNYIIKSSYDIQRVIYCYTLSLIIQQINNNVDRTDQFHPFHSFMTYL